MRNRACRGESPPVRPRIRIHRSNAVESCIGKPSSMGITPTLPRRARPHSRQCMERLLLTYRQRHAYKGLPSARCFLAAPAMGHRSSVEGGSMAGPCSAKRPLGCAFGTGNGMPFPMLSQAAPARSYGPPQSQPPRSAQLHKRRHGAGLPFVPAVGIEQRRVLIGTGVHQGDVFRQDPRL